MSPYCYICGSTDDLILVNPRFTKYSTSVCRSCNRRKIKSYYDAKRDLVFDHYGRVCACCKESVYMFLTVDHINNDGNLERWPNGKRIGGVQLYQRIVKEGYPKTYQVLCMNCNFGKRMNNGVCSSCSIIYIDS